MAKDQREDQENESGGNKRMTKKKTLTDEDKQELDESVDTWKQRLAERWGNRWPTTLK